MTENEPAPDFHANKPRLRITVEEDGGEHLLSVTVSHAEAHALIVAATIGAHSPVVPRQVYDNAMMLSALLGEMLNCDISQGAFAPQPFGTVMAWGKGSGYTWERKVEDIPSAFRDALGGA